MANALYGKGREKFLNANQRAERFGARHCEWGSFRKCGCYAEKCAEHCC